mmetsp:Transcript_11804/g.34085  ORF Transcript_11804/g.34085 Transcript_11804/m.34085 type:complete len:105 (-) Transcript_11804:101-415(-)
MSLKLDEYRAIIDDFELDVSKGVGGPHRRTKDQLKEEVLEALEVMPLEDFEHFVDGIETASLDHEFQDVKEDVRNALLLQCARLRDWVSPEEAKQILRDLIVDL